MENDKFDVGENSNNFISVFTSKLFNSKYKKFAIFLGVAFGLALVVQLFVTLTADASGTITGRVFQDYDGDGTYDTTQTIANSSGVGTISVAVDVGISGVTVTVYDSAGVQRGTTNTVAGGTYSLAATGTGPYRVEFTNLPAGFSPSARSTDSVSGGTATDSGSTVQFVLDGNTSNVNLAIANASEYCENNPEVISTLYAPGDQITGTNSNLFTLISFPYSAGSNDTSSTAALAQYDNPTANAISLQAFEIGTTFGVAYSRSTNRIYTSSYFKKHAGFGVGRDSTTNTSDDAGAIYVIDPVNDSVVTTFTVPNATTNSHDVTDYNEDNFNTGWGAVGKTSLGGLALSEDETKLYVMNLEERTLYSLNPSTGAVFSRQAVPLSLPSCPATTDARPLAVEVYRGTGYVGMVCSAQSSQNRNDLRGYIYTFNLNTLAFSASPVFQFQLNYPRGKASTTNLPGDAEWLAWADTYSNINPNNRIVYPQPMFSAIAFDNGNLVIGLRDRVSDQVGANTPSNPASVGTLYQPRPGGDTLRACGNPTSGWTLESNGRCGGVGSSQQNTGQGPGSGVDPNGYGEYYSGDAFTLTAGGITGAGSNHDEVSQGSVLQLPGAPDVMIGVFDSIPNVTSAIHDAGPRWLNNTTGAFTKAYRIYDGDTSGGPTFGKSGGIGGEMITVCSSTPLELGNRVWRDANDNGVQDAGEAVIANVTVRLYRPGFGLDGIAGNADDNTALATAVTDANGEYYFTSGTGDGNTGNNIGILNGNILPNTTYEIRIDNNANFTAGGPLNGLNLTVPNSIASNGDDDANDSDGVYDPNTNCSATSNACPTISFTTGNAGQSNHTLEFGFTSTTTYAPTATYSLGNRIWFDTDNSGTINGSEVGIPNVSVSVFVDVDNNNVADNLNTPLQTVFTNSTGYYRFDGLTAGNYVVRVNPINFILGGSLAGYSNSVTTEADPDSAVDSNDNGLNPANLNNPLSSSVGILSGTVTVGPGTAEPLNEADLGTIGQGVADNRADMTLDFGFYRISLSGTVWNDNNNDSTLAGGETGAALVTVRLYDNAGNEIPVGPDGVLGTADDTSGGMLTDASGNYSFSGLAAGDYVAYIVPPTGLGSSAGNTVAPDPDNNTDNDDNGTPGTGATLGFIVSQAITLTAGGEPTVTNSTGSTSNPTLDFGLISVGSVGNRVWFDTNNNNTIDGAEVGIANVSVSVFLDGNNDNVIDNTASPLVTVSTDSAGYYRFDNLANGNYIVRINPSNFQTGGALVGYRNTTGATDPDTDAADNNDNGVDPTGAANTVQTNGIISHAVTLSGTTEPTGETEPGSYGAGSTNGVTAPDNQSNLTLDFGFYRLSLSGTVWRDLNNNGLLSGAGETGIINRIVRLYASNGTTEIPVGPDGILGTADDANGGMLTIASGNYSFSGLSAPSAGTDYIVKLTPPATGTSSTGTANAYEPAPDPDNNVDNDDNGTTGTGGNNGLFVSLAITLTPGTNEPSIDNSTGTTSNPTLDFGIYFSPTEVKLVSFNAYQEGNQVFIKWESGFEVDNLGYNIIRESGNGRELVTPSMVAGSALQVGTGTMMTAGNGYAWTETLSNDKMAAGVRYWLEAVDINGERVLHGPFVPQYGIPKGGIAQRAKTLDEVGQSANDVQFLREFPSMSVKKSKADRKPLAENQNQQITLAGGRGAKITVRQDGWYRVSAEQLNNVKFDISSNSANWRLFAEGQERAMKVNTDGSIEFYGQSLDSRSSDARVYWLIEGDSAGQRIELNQASVSGAVPTSTFMQTVERRDRTLRFSSLLNGDEDNFFGATITSTPLSQSVEVTKPDAQANGMATVEVSVQGMTYQNHSVEVSFNGAVIGAINSNGHQRPNKSFEVPVSSVREGKNVVTLTSVAAGSDVSLVDYVRITYPRKAEAVNNRLVFSTSTNQPTHIAGFATQQVRLVDVTNPSAPIEVTAEAQNENGQFGFTLPATASARKIVAFANGTEFATNDVKMNIASSLNRATNSADMLIITTSGLRKPADMLRVARQNQGLNTMIVDVEDVYDEFSYGAHDPNGLQAFLRTALTTWQVKPRFVLFMGDASYDPRNYQGAGGHAIDLVPTKMVDADFMEAASDEALADVDGDGVSETAIGRIPVRTKDEAIAVVEKLLAYEQGVNNAMERGGVIISDSAIGYDFTLASQQVISTLPTAMNKQVITRDDADINIVRDRIKTAFSNGAAVVNFMGHGSTTSWTSAPLLSSSDSITNQRLPLVVMMACLNGSFGEGRIESIAESLLKNPNGGAVGVWASTGLAMPDAQLELNKRFYQSLFSNQNVTFGEAVRVAKQGTQDDIVRKTWIFFGDPSMRLR